MADTNHMFVRGRVEKWFFENGFGFLQVGDSTVFVHSNCARRSLYLKQGSEAFVKVVKDLSKDGDKFKATEAWNIADFELDQAAQAAQRSADCAKQAAELTVRASERVSQRLQSVRMMGSPPGLIDAAVPTIVAAVGTLGLQATSEIVSKGGSGCSEGLRLKCSSLMTETMCLYAELHGEMSSDMKTRLLVKRPIGLREYCDKLCKMVMAKHGVDEQKNKLWQLHTNW